MTTDHLACVSCSYFVGGHCRRNPPITMQGGWPRIESPAVEWCGEHRAKVVETPAEPASESPATPAETTPIGVVVEPDPEPPPVLSFAQSPRKRPKSS